VHRDLKPANVMLLDSERDLVKVLDFGLAKSLSNDSGTTSMTGSGALLGTPAYMSPEAALGREVDARADLYSLGCMLYVLASGRMPFYAESSHELISMQANVVPSPPPGVPASLSAVIMRLLEKDPAKRYQTAVDTREAIDAAVIASRMSTPLALDRTLPQGLPAIPAPVSMNATTIDSSAARPVAKAIESLAPVPAPKRTIWLPLLGFLVLAGAVVFVVLRDPSPPTPPAKSPGEAPALVTPDAAHALAATDAAIDAGAIDAVVVDAAVIDAPKRSRPSRPTRPGDQTVARPDAAVVSEPPPIDAAPVAPPDAGTVKTPW